MLPLAPEGYPFILVPLAAGVLAAAFGYWPVAAVLWLVAAFCVAFFRDPARASGAPPAAILAPADGRVCLVGASPSSVVELGLPVQVSIFMSPANVHVNRAPVAGTVREARYSRGRHFPAFQDKSSDANEHSFVLLDSAQGPVAFKQVAGTLARRVVCDLVAGQRVERGQRVGIIKFSSRVDLFLPAGVELHVAEGERTRAGVTVVASFPAEAGLPA
ncbi:MAG TPA: phosphatidylserine decarboxylase [Thermoanaerobaculaceae bacterium]|nr:phosphatidylserine decarboxylase [Thermoanaerobaculaceae bacterium]HRS16874.1 phosphatidylserine decarboxylase [Thermoanaerobaculaceae bacterium]